MSDIKKLLEIIERDDPVEVEGARDLVTPALLPELARHYPSLDDWYRKLALVNLVQDHVSSVTRPMMLDILNAPEEPDSDYVQITKAVALCHLDNDLARFNRYYEDRGLLAARVREYREKSGDGPHAAPGGAVSRGKARANRQGLTRKREHRTHLLATIVATVALIVGPLALLLGASANQTLGLFREEGVSAQARVINKRRLPPRRRCIAVSYFDAPLLEGGKLQRSEECDFAYGAVWSALQKGDRVEVLFLPREPSRFILKSALQEENRPLLHDPNFGITLILVGLLSAAIAWTGYRPK